MYLYGLLKVEHFPVDLVPDHPGVHLGIHHLDGRHGLKQAKPATVRKVFFVVVDVNTLKSFLLDYSGPFHTYSMS